MKQALIIFVRHPVLGKVKTRLAATVGNEAALAIYKKLLHHTFTLSQKIEADKFVFYSEEVVEDDLWQHKHYYKFTQKEGDLGERMKQAFQQVFSKGYTSVCIIGSDCHDLSSAIIEGALSILSHRDVVIGPALDGGYYLLGMNKLHAELFLNKSWSTENVLTETIETIENLKLSFFKLPVLNDVDEASAMPKEWLPLKN